MRAQYHHTNCSISEPVAVGTGRPVLNIEDLWVEFPVFGGRVQALNGVSLQVRAGEVVGLVGESGSGKSVTAMMAMRLRNAGPYRVEKLSLPLTEDCVFGFVRV